MSCIFDYGPYIYFFFPPSSSGLKQSEAESCYINIARTLEFYGVELHSGRVCLHCDFFTWGKKILYANSYTNLLLLRTVAFKN